MPVIHIDGRIKRLFSIHQKLKRQKIDLDQVYDLVALRIVTQSVKDCYAALGIIHQTWSPVPGRIKDFIAMPRPERLPVAAHLGGQRARLPVRGADPHRGDAPDRRGGHRRALEVQGRPRRRRPRRAVLLWLRQLLEWQQEVRDPQEFLQNLKIELYPEEVYIFTPKGEVKALPRGATPVDFAYAIHTDVGHQCVGARVNGKMVPLRTRLRNGDIVEIVTAPGHKPSRDWLNFVATSRARNKIKHFIHAEEKVAQPRARAKLFEKEARRFGLNMKSLLDGDGLAGRSATTGCRRPTSCSPPSATASSRAKAVLAKLVPQEQLKERAAGAPASRRSSAACSGPARTRSRSAASTT